MRRFLRDERGNIALLGALASSIVVAGAGFGVETGYWYYEQKHLVPNKSVGGSVKFVPLFSQLPSRGRQRPARR